MQLTNPRSTSTFRHPKGSLCRQAPGNHKCSGNKNKIKDPNIYKGHKMPDHCNVDIESRSIHLELHTKCIQYVVTCFKLIKSGLNVAITCVRTWSAKSCERWMQIWLNWLRTLRSMSLSVQAVLGFGILNVSDRKLSSLSLSN